MIRNGSEKKEKFQILKQNVQSCSVGVEDTKFPEDRVQKSHLKLALNIISRRMVTKKELMDKFKTKYQEEISEDVVEKLENMKLIDDEKVAEIECRNLAERKFYANSRIKIHLMKRGLSNDLISKYLNSDDEKTRALSLLRRKYNSANQKEKASRLLFSYGYSHSIIKSCIEEYFNEFS